MKNATQFVHAIYHDIWQGKDIEKFSTYYHPDAKATMDKEILNYDEILQHAIWQKEHAHDIVFDFQTIISEADHIAFWFHSSGIWEDKNKNYTVMGFYQLKDGKVIRIEGLCSPNIDFKKQL